MNEIWTADLMNGPQVGGRAVTWRASSTTRSRFLTGHQFVRRPDAVRFAGVLRAAIAAHGIPRTLYTDNGSCFADESLAADVRGAGHQADPQPARAADGAGEDRARLRDYPAAVPGRGHRRRRSPGPPPGQPAWRSSTTCWTGGSARSTTPGSHSETGEAPQARYQAAGPAALPDPVLLREAFRGARSGWSARPPPSPWRATCTRWTRSSRAGRWSWSSTRST